MSITPGVQIIPFSPSARLALWTQIGPSDSYLEIPDLVDANGNIINPSLSIHDPSRQVFGRWALPARRLGLRMRYTTPVTIWPRVKVFGRTRLPDGAAGRWQVLKNRLFDATVTIPAAPSDVVDSGDLRLSTADPLASYFDLQGCNEFLVGVELRTDAEDAALQAQFV